MGYLFGIVEDHRMSQTYPPSLRDVAEKLEVQAGTVTGWKNPKDLPERKNLDRLSELTGVPYTLVLRAVLIDIGYLRPDQDVPRMPPRSTIAE